jgi:hypothetical protein
MPFTTSPRYPGASEHRIETRGELRVPVTHQEPESIRPLTQIHQQVPRNLRHPHTTGAR